MRQQLGDLICEQQKEILKTLPLGAKIPLALDYWTCSFRQAWKAIKEYVDKFRNARL